MSNTYGSNSDFPGVTVQTTGGSVSDPTQQMVSDINLWGHSIVLDGDSGIECQACDMEEEIPELLSMSSGFREVVYKMYILGKFRKQSCNPDPEDIEDMMDDLNKNVDPITRKNHRVPPSNIHWSGNTTTTSSAQSDTVDMYVPQGQRMMMDGTEYIYHGDGTWVDTDRNAAFGTVDLIDKHGKTAKKHFPPEIVQEKEDKLQRRKDMMNQQSLDTVGISDIQDAGVDTGSIQTDTVTNISIDADTSDLNAAEKMDRGLQDKAGHFLTR